MRFAESNRARSFSVAAVEEIRGRTTLFCGIIAFAIALSMLLRGRRSAHWLFAAFSTCIAFWYVSQSLADIVKDQDLSRYIL